MGKFSQQKSCKC